MSKSKINWKLLKKCRKLFVEHPSKAMMDDFCKLKSYCRDAFFAEEQVVPICKTYLCIGGSAMLLSGKYELRGNDYFYPINGNYPVRPWGEARKILGLTENQADMLFDEPNWPEQFRSDKNNTGSRTLAQNMVRRIDHFIKTKGKE